MMGEHISMKLARERGIVVMTMKRRIIAMALCVMLLAGLAVVASAASRTFLRKNIDGYSCVGSGSVSSSTAIATFTADPLSDEPHILPADCRCSALIAVIDSQGNPLGSTLTNGTTYARAVYNCQGGKSLSGMGCKFTFMGAAYGTYFLYT